MYEAKVAAVHVFVSEAGLRNGQVVVPRKVAMARGHHGQHHRVVFSVRQAEHGNHAAARAQRQCVLVKLRCLVDVFAGTDIGCALTRRARLVGARRGAVGGIHRRAEILQGVGAANAAVVGQRAQVEVAHDPVGVGR